MNVVKPIKSIEQIEAMKNELGKYENKGYANIRIFEAKRNRAIFCVGINSALRVSDIRVLNLIDVFDENLRFNDVGLKEKKTHKNKEFPITDTLKEELKDYIFAYFYVLYKIDINNLSEEEKEIVKQVVQNEPLFPSEKRWYLSRIQIYRILNKSAEKIGLEKIGTHTMRKTFGYWFYKRTKDIALLQKLLNHSSPRETMIYIGLEQEEINNAYKSFGL